MHSLIEDYYTDAIDEALCKLNKEYLEVKSSSEYNIGLKIKKLIYALKEGNFKAIQTAINHKAIHKRLKPYFKKNDVFYTFDKTVFTNTRIAVYTAITGNYDLPIEPLYVPQNVDFYIVTDMEISANSVWKKIDINLIGKISRMDSTRKARFAKIHPHLFFKDYEYSIWIDSNFKAVGDLSKFIKCIGKEIPFASNWHPDRNSIYTELDACVMRKKDDESLLKKQVEFYKKEGMPDDFGLIETNMIVRKHMDCRCISLMEAWWEEIRRWSKRDQLSLPYVIWKQGYSMKDLGFIGNEVRENTSVQVVLHANDIGAKHK